MCEKLLVDSVGWTNCSASDSDGQVLRDLEEPDSTWTSSELREFGYLLDFLRLV
jgi:hypothetical protein